MPEKGDVQKEQEDEEEEAVQGRATGPRNGWHQVCCTSDVT